MLRSLASLSKTFSVARAATPSGATFSRYYAAEPAVKTSDSKVILTFACPHAVISKQEEVDFVNVPSTAGRYGIHPNHVPIISELVPGVVLVGKGNETTKYFVSTGFISVHPGSRCEISAVEAIPVENLDKAAALAGLEEATKSLQLAKSDYEKAEAQIGVEVSQALISAIDGTGY